MIPLVIEAKLRGQHIVQIFQDGTGQHEKGTAAFLRRVRRGTGRE